MDTVFTQGLAISGIALVAIFPTPTAMVDALFPFQDTEIVRIDRNSPEAIRVGIVSYGSPLVETVTLPRIPGCDYDLDQITPAIIDGCRDDLRAVANDPDYPLDRDAEMARLALLKLCQNYWGHEPSAELLLRHPECADLR